MPNNDQPIKFDINEVLPEMMNAIKGTVEDNWSEVKSIANEFLTRRRERLELLTELALTGDLPLEKMKSRLEDEKLILEAELHAIAIISQAVAQKAANAALDVLYKAVKGAIDMIL
jgi:hypothetical protein